MKQPNLTSQILLAEKFNSLYLIGSSVSYRVDEFSDYKSLTTRTEAFIANGMAVVFFVEKSGYYDISKTFVKY